VRRAPNRQSVAAPEGLTVRYHRDLEGRERRPFVRRALLWLVGLLLVVGLANVFGQSPSSATATGDVAELELSAPTKLRSGLYYQARFRITALEELEAATLVLDPDWLDGMTLNTITPAPVGEASRDGRIAFELGRIPAGDEHLFFLQLQVNPTTTGRRSQHANLYDGERLVASIERTLTVWP
jgi:hypothetical protein